MARAIELIGITKRFPGVVANDGVHFEPAGGDIIARLVLKALNERYDLTSWKKRG